MEINFLFLKESEAIFLLQCCKVVAKKLLHGSFLFKTWKFIFFIRKNFLVNEYLEFDKIWKVLISQLVTQTFFIIEPDLYYFCIARCHKISSSATLLKSPPAAHSFCRWPDQSFVFPRRPEPVCFLAPLVLHDLQPLLQPTPPLFLARQLMGFGFKNKIHMLFHLSL